jgi:hypothetical protein
MKIKREIKIKSFIIILILPIFFYINNNQISFNECSLEGTCIAFGLGSTLLILLLPYYILKDKLYFLISLSIFLIFLIEYLLLLDVFLILVTLKSLMPFLFLLFFFSVKSIIKLKKQSIKFYLEKFIPYTVVFFQIIILFSTSNFFESRSGIFFLEKETDRWPNFIISFFKVYNYNQYFSFILVLASSVRIFSSLNKLEVSFFILIMFYGCLDANNVTAFLCATIIIIYKILYPLLLKLKNEKIISKFFSFFFLSLFFLIPIFSFIFVESIIYISEVNDRLESLEVRLIRWEYIMSNLNMLNMLSGIYPEPFIINQPHNQFLEYVLFFGIVKSFLLLGVIYFVIYRISEIKYLIPISIIIGIGGSMTEIITHFYTSQILFLYIIFASSVARKHSSQSLNFYNQ